MHETKAIMTSDVVFVREDTPISQVIELLVEHDITGIPVVDAQDRLVGIVRSREGKRSSSGLHDD